MLSLRTKIRDLSHYVQSKTDFKFPLLFESKIFTVFSTRWRNENSAGWGEKPTYGRKNQTDEISLIWKNSITSHLKNVFR